MFGIGFPELMLILLVALVIFGPSKLPDLAKTLGKAVREFRKATDEFHKTLGEENRCDDENAKHDPPETKPEIHEKPSCDERERKSKEQG